jgi:hypothetical protein
LDVGVLLVPRPEGRGNGWRSRQYIKAAGILKGRGKALGIIATGAESLASLPRVLARGLESGNDLGVLTLDPGGFFTYGAQKQLDHARTLLIFRKASRKRISTALDGSKR